MVRLLRAVDYRAVAWKNGGGITREIAVNPHGAGNSAFLWRVSIATVSEPGPFSIFQETDRSIAVLNGAGIVMHSKNGNVTLTSESDPFAFDGEMPVEATVIDGETTDLNVMTKRGHFVHSMEKQRLKQPTFIHGDTGETIIVVNGDVAVTTSSEQYSANPLDSLLCIQSGTEVRLSPKGHAEVFVIRISNIT